MHSDLLAIVLLQFWFCRDHLLTIRPMGKLFPNNPNSSTFLSICPKQQHHTLNGTVFLQKLASWLFFHHHTNRPQNTRTDWGVSGILFKVKHGTQLQANGSGLLGTQLASCSIMQKDGKTFFCALLTSEPAALKCRYGACWPASQLASPQEFFMLQSPSESSFS